MAETARTPPADVVARLRAAGCVFAEDEARMLAAAATGPAHLDALVRSRAAGLPIEQVVGWARFRDLRITVRPGVFVPRRRSEYLVDVALRAAAGRRHLVAVDLCCGSGALGAALAAELAAAGATVRLHAADVDPAAVRCARTNLPATAAVHSGDLYRALPATLRGHVDLLLANVPYVPAGELHLLPAEARDHEPRGTLDGGADGLDVARRVLGDATHWLAAGGRVLIEITPRQAGAAGAAARAADLHAEVTTCQDRDATVLVATRGPAEGPVPGR